MATESVESVKKDAVIKIEVSSACYHTVKNMFLEHLDQAEDQKELIIRLCDSKDLTLHELNMRFLLDFIKECEESARKNNQTEQVEITVPDNPNEDPS